MRDVTENLMSQRAVSAVHRIETIRTNAPVALMSLLAGLTLLRYWIALRTGLTDDEAYYRLWSLGPSLSFLDHPPFVAWIIAAGRWIAGDTPVGVRFLGPLVLGAGTLILWRTATLLTDVTTVLWAVVFLMAMPLLSIGSVVMTPDLPSVYFYGLVLLSLAELDRSQNANWWLATGLFAGLGLLSKYTNFFAGIVIVLWLVVVPRNRKWASCVQFWLGGLLAAAIFSPVIVWNAAHGWSSFAKQFGRIGASEGIGILHPVELVAGMAFLESPLIAILAGAGLISCGRRLYAKGDSKDWLIVLSIVPMLGYFALHSLHGRVQANWLAPIYPPLAISAAMGLTTMIPVHWRLRVGTAAAFAGLATTLAIFAFAAGSVPLLRKDPTAQMRGWPELAAEIDRARSASGARWLATSSYATTGQLAFALKDSAHVAQLSERIRYEHLPQLSSSVANSPALYVELQRRSNEALLTQCFTNVRPLSNLTRSTVTGRRETYVVYFVGGISPECLAAGGELRAAPVAAPAY